MQEGRGADPVVKALLSQHFTHSSLELLLENALLDGLILIFC